jgi:ubiquinone/menaquinone biosynthesis C-methylase UbiE
MREAFPDSEIVLLDPSSQSLDIARTRFPGQAHCQPFDGQTIPYGDGHFDLVFTACVFHHIPEELHVGLLAEIGRVMKPDGSFFLFEHNPSAPDEQPYGRCRLFQDQNRLPDFLSAFSR